MNKQVEQKIKHKLQHNQTDDDDFSLDDLEKLYDLVGEEVIYSLFVQIHWVKLTLCPYVI